uniref:Uncharacterized protein n=1 Tax=Magnetococcus massalia (strain MO-1) TaxID=451514 RepID=A0A1S7LHB2_MAGMO|nr:protein of unknown function [Candidatus Magnetococcus massalia]
MSRRRSSRSPSSQAIDELMNFIEKEPWSGLFDELLDFHLNETCECLNINPDDLLDLLGEEAFATLWGSILEDFATKSLPPENKTVVDHLLKRRAWKLPYLGKEYLKALKNSHRSLYEVTDVSPGSDIILRDLVLDQGELKVLEKVGSHYL